MGEHFTGLKHPLAQRLAIAFVLGPDSIDSKTVTLDGELLRAAMDAIEESGAAAVMVLQADREAPAMGLPYGLADCIDNDGHPYQSAALAQALALLKTALLPVQSTTLDGAS